MSGGVLPPLPAHPNTYRGAFQPRLRRLAPEGEFIHQISKLARQKQQTRAALQRQIGEDQRRQHQRAQDQITVDDGPPTAAVVARAGATLGEACRLRKDFRGLAATGTQNLPGGALPWRGAGLDQGGRHREAG